MPLLNGNHTSDAEDAIYTKTKPVYRAAPDAKALAASLQNVNVSPLWAQMARLNPEAPNPRCKPFIWEYNNIRPYLEDSGRLITEKQAERRVLMLVNPERGE